jgi:uncharacterized protein YhbP (UPF0306 family)
MTQEEDREAIARAMIDANLYMTLATADATGRPWASPVYYAVAGYREFFWISEPEATHSRNLASRPELAIVIFDSTAPINTGRGVYMPAVAEELEGAELERGIELFSRRSQEHGGEPFTVADVQPPATLRLYRATASEHSLLEFRRPHRVPVSLA